MKENPQNVNSAADVFTSDGVPRSNLMTADQWLQRVLYSGRVTRVAQHLALVIFTLATLQQKNGVRASARDLERITGWGRSTIHDHLEELEDFIHIERVGGRGKTLFELQGMIEDAIGAALASGLIVRQPDTTPDTKFASAVAAKAPDTTPDTSVVANQPDAVVASQPDTKPEAQAEKNACSNTTRATNESSTKILSYEERERVPASAAIKNPTPHMNGVGFVIDERRGAVIPADVVSLWREKFTDIPDLEAAMQNLSCNLLSSLSHKGWSCPEGWMVSILANMNQEAKDKKRVADAKIAGVKPKPFKPSRW